MDSPKREPMVTAMEVTVALLTSLHHDVFGESSLVMVVTAALSVAALAAVAVWALRTVSR